MKKPLFSLLLLVFSLNIVAKTKVIINPYYEVTTSGIYNFTKIELNDKETRLFVHCTFLPKWWVQFTPGTFIEDSETGEKLFATGMKGKNLGEKIYMPASGDTSFVLIFPPLNKNVKRIDYGENDKVFTYGLSLDPRKKRTEGTTGVPDSVKEWIAAELAKAKNKTLVEYGSPQFFSKDTARLIGYIKGYDRRLGFSSGMIYANNQITWEDFPVVLQVHDNGRFEAKIPMNYPQYSYFRLNNQGIFFYLEPGQTLSTVINWEEFLTADRLRNTRYRFTDIQFEGPAARINEELMSVTLKEPDYRTLQKSVQSQNPEEFKSGQLAYWNQSLKQLDEALNAKEFLPQSKTILRNEINVRNAAFLFDYLMEYASRKDSANAVLKVPVQASFYDFLRRFSLNDPTLLMASRFSTFINRFEFSAPFTRIPVRPPGKSFKDFIFTDLRMEPSSEDKAYFNFQNEFHKRLSMISVAEKASMAKELNELSMAFSKRYDKYTAQYNAKYPVKPSETIQAENLRKEWKIKDSLLLSYFQLQPNFVYEITKVRSLKYTLEKMLVNSKDAGRAFLTDFEDGITHPFLLRESERMFHKVYPQISKAAYELPDGKGADVFRKIIDPYKGKMLLVDFWGIFCGPCIASIKQNKPVRESYKNNKDFAFVFITSELDSPTDRYRTFVKEQEMEKSYLLSNDDYVHLRQLFKFNGIPRYVLIDKDGKILNDDFEMYNFEGELKKFKL